MVEPLPMLLEMLVEDAPTAVRRDEFVGPTANGRQGNTKREVAHLTTDPALHGRDRQMFHGPIPSASAMRCAAPSKSRTRKQVWWSAPGSGLVMCSSFR